MALNMNDGIFLIEDGVLTEYSGELADVAVPEGTEEIADYLFCDHTELVSVKLPSTLRSIGASAFEGSGIREIDVPRGVTHIGEDAFYDCASLESVALPASLTEIADNLFAGCSALDGVKVPEKVTRIGQEAFSGCI